MRKFLKKICWVGWLSICIVVLNNKYEWHQISILAWQGWVILLPTFILVEWYAQK